MPILPSFTKRSIDALAAAPAGTRLYYEDARTPSLRLAVTDRGAKSWVVQRRIGGRVTRITLGRYPDLTPENARKKAEQVVGEIAAGYDPQEQKREARAKRLTLQEAFDEFLKRRQLKPATQASYGYAIKGPLRDWLPRPMMSITKDVVAERHAKLSLTSPGHAASAMRTFRSIWNFAAAGYEDASGESLLGPNPVDRLSKTKAWHRLKRRDTYIREQDLPAWFDAVQALRAEPWSSTAKTVGDYLMLLLLTGLRRREGSDLMWEQIDFSARTLRVLDTKNHDDHVLPLSDFLMELLRDRATHRDGSAHVFPGASPSKPFRDPKKQLRKVIERSGVDFCLHDLRRTFCTAAESLDLSHYALKRLLNHRMTGDVTAGYIGKNIERLREPMQRITNFFLNAANQPSTSSVITFPSSLRYQHDVSRVSLPR